MPDFRPWIGLFAILTALAMVGSVVLDSNIALWVAFAAVVALCAAAGARARTAMSAGQAKWLALVSFILLPAAIGYFAWKTSGSPQWLMRLAIGAILGAGGGLIVGSRVFEREPDAEPRGQLMQFFHAYRQGANTMAGVSGVISAALVFPTVIISVVNVVLRRVGASQGRNLTSNGLIEAQWYLYGLIFILGFAYILRDSINVRVDFWFGNRSSKTQSWIDLCGHFIGLLPLAYIGIKYSWPAVEISWANNEKSPDAGGLYRPPIKTALMIAFVFLAIQGVAEVIKNIEYLRGHEFRSEDDNPALAGGQTFAVDDFDVKIDTGFASASDA